MATQVEPRKVSTWWQFPGWRAVAAGTIQAVVGHGFVTYSWTVYVRVLREEFGWTSAMMGALGSMARIPNVGAAPLGGWSSDRWGGRASLVWLAVMGLGWVGIATTVNTPDDYWQLFIYYSLILYGAAAGGLYRISYPVANQWFIERRARGIAIITLGGGFGGVVFTPLVAVLALAYGWRPSALMLAALVALLGVAPAFLYPRGRPEQMGYYPDNLTPEERQQRAAARRVPAQFAELSTREALRSASFWLIVLAGFATTFAGAPVSIFQNVRMGAVGYSVVAAAAFYSFNRLMTYVGRGAVVLFGDWVSARMQPRFVLAICYAFHVVAFIFFAVGTGDFEFYTWAIIYGVFSGVVIPYLANLMGAYFGRQAFGLILGLRYGLAGLGGFVSPFLTGWLSDVRAGDWTAPFVIIAGAYGVAAIVYCFATPPKPRQAGPTA